MRLFGKVDGTVDRYDRAGWLTPIFDLAFGAPSAAVQIKSAFAAQPFITAICKSQPFIAATFRTQQAVAAGLQTNP